MFLQRQPVRVPDSEKRVDEKESPKKIVSVSPIDRWGYANTLMNVYATRGRTGSSTEDMRISFMNLLKGHCLGLASPEQLEAWEKNTNDKEVVDEIIRLVESVLYSK